MVVCQSPRTNSAFGTRRSGLMWASGQRCVSNRTYAPLLPAHLCDLTASPAAQAVRSLVADATPRSSSADADLSADEIQLRDEERKKNVAFHFVTTAAKNLLEFGGVAVAEVPFRETMILWS